MLDQGSHRYPLGFSGDSVISWASLDFQPYFTVQLQILAILGGAMILGAHARLQRCGAQFKVVAIWGIFTNQSTSFLKIRIH